MGNVKHTFSLRVDNTEIYESLKQISKKRGYRSVNKLINDILKEAVSKEATLPGIFYKTKEVDKYIKLKREDIYDRF
ncbi:MAG: hypothetical protein M1576_03800 [Deltaproteobacteria bacterium]|jgi:hypothetical protein|nr:hypothetical protein [Deltaproteobacteria bacterium]